MRRETVPTGFHLLGGSREPAVVGETPRPAALHRARTVVPASIDLRAASSFAGNPGSVIALIKAGVEPGSAKMAVHESPVWRDRHAADTSFHAPLERAVDDLVRTEQIQVATAGKVRDEEIDVQYKGVTITIADPASIKDGKPTPAAVRRYEALLGRLAELRRFAASKFLSLYNETWRDDDHGILDAEGFAQRLTNPSLTVCEDGMTLVYFEDGDMFGGHYIEVETSDGEPTHAEIAG